MSDYDSWKLEAPEKAEPVCGDFCDSWHRCPDGCKWGWCDQELDYFEEGEHGC